MQKRELLVLMANFLEALIHCDPKSVPVAKNVKATYQGAQAPLGSGDIWAEARRRIPYRQTFVDEVTQTVCFSGVVTNNMARPLWAMSGPEEEIVDSPERWMQRWWIYFVRLTANEDGQICEIEEIARRETGAGLGVRPEQMEPPRILEAPLPADARSTRKEMIKIASQYWDGVNKLIDPGLVPIHPDVRLFEVGTPVTDSMTHSSSMKTNYTTARFKWECIKRRFPVVDEDTGVCISTNHMIAQEPSSPTGYVTDIFKIEYGLIKYIFAFHDHGITFVDWEGVGPQTSAECD
ncbi:MAG: hypothetical protein FWG28_05285 [Clostridiales bacterium]|nr:hypothetical protein [Clostridiales bacterium]